LRFDAITLKQLRALLAVADTGSLTMAADLLHQTPPTIHSQIKNLEGAVGEALLQKASDGSGFQPTLAGQEMLAAAQRIEANLSHAERQITALTQGRRGHVVLGTVSTAKYFVPRLVRLLQDRIPDVEISLRVANRSDVMQALNRGDYDLAIMGRPPRGVIHRAIPLGPHPHGIVLPPDHPLAQEDGYDPDRLLGDKESLGITLALIPTETKGIEIAIVLCVLEALLVFAHAPYFDGVLKMRAKPFTKPTP